VSPMLPCRVGFSSETQCGAMAPSRELQYLEVLMHAVDQRSLENEAGRTIPTF
jgi:hypothetical protein